MLVFDVLDQLETYAPIIPHMDDVINVMDHSKPYDDDPGEYKCREKGDTHIRFQSTFPVRKAFLEIISLPTLL